MNRQLRSSLEDRNILDKFAENFCEIVEKHVKYIVVSGFVAISHGRSRATEDIDMIIERMSFNDFEKMHNELTRKGFICMQSSKIEDVYDYLDKGDSIRYVEREDMLPPEMEVKFVKDEIDKLQIKERKKFIFTGLDIWFSSIEMNVAFKEELLKSDKDMEDAKHLRIIYKEEISEKQIEHIKRMIIELRLKK